MIIDIYNIDSDEERPGLLIKWCKLGYHRHHEDRDYKSKETNPLLSQAEACGQDKLSGTWFSEALVDRP